MRKLHVGGWVRTPGWEVIDANPGPHVDHVGNAKDLSRFDTATFTDIYASHVLEHFDFKYAQGSGRLVLSKVEPDEPVTPPGRGKGTRKKAGGR